MRQEIALFGEDQLLYSSDYPHGEGRENAAQELLEKKRHQRSAKAENRLRKSGTTAV